MLQPSTSLSWMVVQGCCVAFPKVPTSPRGLAALGSLTAMDASASFVAVIKDAISRRNAKVTQLNVPWVLKY